MDATITSPPPIIPYSEELIPLFDMLYDMVDEMNDRGNERTAQYLVDAGVIATTIWCKYRDGKSFRRYETPGGKRRTVSYDFRTHEFAVGGRVVKNNPYHIISAASPI